MRRDAGQISRAVDACQKGHAADPQATGPLALALSLLTQARSSLKPLLDTAMKTDVQPELRMGYARALLSLQLVTESAAQLMRLNVQHPEFAEGWLIHGLVLHENGQPAEAEKRLVHYVQMLSRTPNPEQQAGLTEALMTLAQMAQKKGQLDRANQWLAQMPAGADPIKLASRQAEVLAQQGRLDEARRVLAQATPTNAEQARRKTLAQSQWLRDNKDAPAAYALMKAAEESQPDDQDLLSEWALVCEKLKRYEEMERLLRQVMVKFPQEAHAFNALGYSLADRNVRLDEAQRLIEKAIELSPDDPFIQDSWGWLKYRQGKLPAALTILQAAYTAKPDAEIAAHLGEVLWVQGQTLEAAAIWRAGLLIKADNETLVETLHRFKFKP
jgi:tetratricopeptide (TPR) repeat protein